LGKAEAASIAREVGRVVAYGAIAFVLVLFALILLVVGAWLSIDEWLLGSMGWGVIHGFLTSLSFALALVLVAFGVSARRIGRSFLVAFVVGVLIAIGLGLDLPNRLYAEIGERAALGVDPGVRPLIVGLLVGGLVGLVAGLVAAVRMHTSGGGRVAALIGLTILGIVVGAIAATTFGPQVGVGIGLMVGLVTWMALMGVDVARTGIDLETLKQRFYPAQTIDTSKETLEWLQKRMPPGIGS